MSAANSAAAPKTDRRDLLISFEQEYRQGWLDEKAHDVDVTVEDVDSKQGKFFCTFPYPYMNGVLHLGHAFTLAKCDFAARYHKLKGDKVLFPFAFHCTGMPICAAATRLKRELELYGCPPVFPVEVAAPVEVKKAPAKGKGKKKKGGGKSAKKKSTKKWQWDILVEVGVPVELIPKFVDAKFWLNYFPPIAKEHLKEFGLMTDWRRSFITTDENPYYNRFVEWHFNTLKKKGKVVFGNRAAVFSPVDDQPCADHDRGSGEGFGPQEYTIIHLELQQPYPAALQTILDDNKDKNFSGKVILPAATLRPETMYGQTNAFLKPDGNYGVFMMASGDLFVCSKRSALNMAYQNLAVTRGKPDQWGSLTGAKLIGSKIKAPLCQYDSVYLLPLFTIKMGKGTGVVTSVPSDAPDDWAGLTDIQKKPALCEQYGIDIEDLKTYNAVGIIDTPGLGSTPAVDLCIKLKVQSQNDTAKLASIKDQVYLKGFTDGVMIVGEFKGQAVRDVKPVIKKQLIDQGLATVYFEPEGLVMSRTGNECVVAYSDQWYLSYGEKSWKIPVKDHIINTLETYNKKAQFEFEAKVDWLKERACSRQFGLGTLLPWDKQYVVESLSDSTIYMSYYTIAHLLQGGVLNGQETGPSGVTPEQLTDEVWNYIFLNKQNPTFKAEWGIAQTTLDEMKRSFEFWYPLDLRVSGKDLIGNHLTMSVYNHAAIWDEQPEMWPRSFFTNGHLMINAEKMSKNTGNFITLEAALKKFGVDATRLALADAGDTLEDANFDEGFANTIILKLTKEWSFVTENYDAEAAAAMGDATEYKLYSERVFDNAINFAMNEADDAMSKMNFHGAVSSGFYALVNSKDTYRFAATDGKLNPKLVKKYVESLALILAPFCPHFAEKIWRTVLKQDSSVIRASWPSNLPVDEGLISQQQYLEHFSHAVRSELQSKTRKANKKKPSPAVVYNHVDITVAVEYPAWQANVITICAGLTEANDGEVPPARDLLAALQHLKQNKRQFNMIAKFVHGLKKPSDFVLTLPFDEKVFIEEHLAKALAKTTITSSTVKLAVAAEEGAEVTNTTVAAPGKPTIDFITKA